MTPVSLGLGLTNACDLRCAHCYRPDPPERHLPLATIRKVCEALTVGGVNLGTGEAAMHPEFREILAYLHGRALRVSLVSNGTSVRVLGDDELARLHDVEVSIDFPDRERFDAFRGPGAWDAALGALDRCRALGVRTTVLAVLMRANHRELSRLAAVAAEHGAPLRVNIYQPVKTVEFLPTRAEFWWAMRDVIEHTTLLACSEPVVRAATGLPGTGVACGRSSVRVTPAAELKPCVYWPEAAGTADELPALEARVFGLPEFSELQHVPAACVGCVYESTCGGGCASRRRMAGGLDRPDPYCPVAAGIPRLTPRLGDAGARLHVENVCTLLVRA